jgi:uncharacterized protein HemX
MRNKLENLREYIISVDVPEGVKLNGLVPFQTSINQNQGRFKVYATSLEEAKQIVDSYINK